MHRWLLAVLTAVCAEPAGADANFSFALGAREVTDSDEHLAAIGLSMDVGDPGWRFRPELGFAGGFDETEIYTGVIVYWEGSSARFHLGAGFSDISYDFSRDSGSSSGPYLHGGISWLAGRRRWDGIDVRYVDTEDSTPLGRRIPVGYLQISALFTW